jgi:hypothetical protein
MPFTKGRYRPKAPPFALRQTVQSLPRLAGR